MDDQRVAEIQAALELPPVELEIAMETEAEGWLRDLLRERARWVAVSEAARAIIQASNEYTSMWDRELTEHEHGLVEALEQALAALDAG